MTKDEALKLALEALEADPLEMVADVDGHMVFLKDKAITAIKESLAQQEQEPVAYDKTEMNCFVQDLYDKKMQEGKHGHYETMFHVVHQAIKKEREACAKLCDLAMLQNQEAINELEDIDINITWNENSMRDFGKDELNFARAILRKAKEK